MHFDGNPFTRRFEKEDRNAEGFQIWHFYWSFSCDIMVVNGLQIGTFTERMYTER